MNAMLRWMKAATLKERKQLAKHAKTTTGMLRFIAGSHRTGGTPAVKAELAIELERGAEKLRAKNKQLPVLRREKLNRGCEKCEFAKACRG